MTIVRTAYLVDWPQELAPIAHAINSENQEQFNQYVNSFRPSPEALFYSSDGPEYFIHIQSYRIILPVIFYLLKWNVVRDVPPYNPDKICNNIEQVSDKHLEYLGILNNDEQLTGNSHDFFRLEEGFRDIESVRNVLATKEKIIKMMACAGKMFDEVSADAVLGDIPTNPFNFLVLQLENILKRYPDECVGVVNAAIEAGAKPDINTLRCIGNVGQYWFDKFNQLLPDNIRYRPENYFTNSDNRVNYGRNLDIYKLAELGRIEHDIPEGEASWVHKLSNDEQALKVFVELYGHNINHRGNGFATPLIEAINELQSSTIERLLMMGADPNVPDEDGNTALHHAAPRGVKKYVSLLMSVGADPNALNKERKKPKDLADESNMGRKNIPLLNGEEELKWTI